MTESQVDFTELSHGAQRRIMRRPTVAVLARVSRGRGWSLIWPHNAAHREALLMQGYHPIGNIPDKATWSAQPPPQYVVQCGRWGVQVHADGTYTLRRTDCPITLRLTGPDLTDATNALVQVEVARQPVLRSVSE